MKLPAIVLLLSLHHATTLAYTIKNCKYDAYDSSDPADTFKCYNGGLCYRLEHNSSSVLKICTCKPGFTGKHCEHSTLTPCSPDPCSPNGYCNAQTDAIGYYCQCKPGFTGPTCADNVNDCLNATCFNGGLCIDGINSYKCDCQWPFIGRYCQTQMKCSSEHVCKNGAACVQEGKNDRPKCVCPEGFEGADCSRRVDKCASSPCVRGQCSSVLDDYQCQCPLGFTGKNCQHQDPCVLHKPCRNNSTCVTLTIGHDQNYMCQCGHGFTGVNCETIILTVSSTSTRPPLNETDGAFVLVVNISPDEFKQRRHQIISQFEQRFGIMISIKKTQDHEDMIYAINSSTSRVATWTKVYFIFISACIQNEPSGPNSVCLQNSDVNEVLDQLKKSSDLFPKYVTDVSYEAYKSGEKNKKPHDQFNIKTSDSSLTLTLCFVSIALLVGISLALTVIIKQQQRRVKAPVWFPPVSDLTGEQQFDSDKKMSMSFANKFLSRQKSCTMPDNDYSDVHPTKMKLSTIYPVDYYPSPPESLPESLQPANYKTASSGLTPLMLFVLGRSRNASGAGATESADCIDSLVSSGAELHSQNGDGETALHLAARAGLYRICERLMQHRADLNVFDKYGRNALHTAICANQYNIVKLMLDHCNSMLCANNLNLLLDDKYDLIDSKTNDDLGDTGLIIACRLSLNAIVQLLIDYNATVNATDNEGRSALHWCAKVNNVSGACALLKAGANVNMQDNDEKTPLSAGLSEMCTLQVADLLIRHEAFVSGDDEVKYNKMKSVMEAMNGVQSMPRQIKTVKSGVQPSQPSQPSQQLPPPPQENKVLKSVATKRKLNEASAAEGRSVKSKKSAKKSSSPSPPPYTLQPGYSYANHYDLNYSAYYYADSNYAYASGQPFYVKPVCAETKLDAASLGGNVNMGFMGDGGYGAKSAQFQVKQEAAHGPQSAHLYSSQYAAYF